MQNRPVFLTVKYQIDDEISYVFAPDRERLLIDAGTSGMAFPAEGEPLRIVAAVYGTRDRIIYYAHVLRD